MYMSQEKLSQANNGTFHVILKPNMECLCELVWLSIGSDIIKPVYTVVRFKMH